MHYAKLPLFKPCRLGGVQGAFVVSAALSIIGSGMARCNMGTNVRECFQAETIAVNGIWRWSQASYIHLGAISTQLATACGRVLSASMDTSKRREVLQFVRVLFLLSIESFDLIHSFWLLLIACYCCPAAALLYLRTSSADRSLPENNCLRKSDFCVGFLIGFSFALDSFFVFSVLWPCLWVFCCSQLNVWLAIWSRPSHHNIGD